MGFEELSRRTNLVSESGVTRSESEAAVISFVRVRLLSGSDGHRDRESVTGGSFIKFASVVGIIVHTMMTHWQ